MTKKNKTVDEYLNEVDYVAINNYVPSAFSIQYLNFLKIITTGTPAESDIVTSPPAHFKMIDGLCDTKQYLANLCSRGLSKTVLFAETLFLYLAVYQYIPGFGRCNTAMYVADSMEGGAKNLRKNIESRYNDSPQLRALLPIAKFTDPYIEFENVAGQKFGLKIFGAQSFKRGTKIFGKRPELAVLDDLVSDEDAHSQLALNKIKETIYRGVLPSLDPNRRKVIFNGTPFNKADPLYEAIESGGWYVNVYPVCEEFPCKEKDFKGAWEARFSYDAINKYYQLCLETNEIKAFRQEMMLRIASDEDRMIDPQDIMWFKRQEILENMHKYNFYITTDFATSTARRADYTCIGVWAVDYRKRRYLVDGTIGRQLMNKTFDDIFKYVKKYNPQSVGLEISGQQGGFISLFREQMAARNTWFTIAKAIGTNKEGIGVKTNKMERFKVTVPHFKNNKIYLPNEMKDSILLNEIEEELSLVTIDGIKSKHDDAIDMISQLDQMYLVYPSKFQHSLSKEDSKARLEGHLNGSILQNDHNFDSYLA